MAGSTDEIVSPDQDIHGDQMVLNMGPSHPSTHGVFRLILHLDGEVIQDAVPDVGYLHRGFEKIAEADTFHQFIPYTDRLDYLGPLAMNVGYVQAVEKAVQLEVPERAKFIRVICCELARINAHLLGLGAFAMDVGAMTVFLFTFREREKVYDLIEGMTGTRLTTSYTRIGGVARDVTPEWIQGCRDFIEQFPAQVDDVDKLLSKNKIWVKRTEAIGVLDPEKAVALGVTGPNLRGSGVDWDLRRDMPYLVYDRLEFDVPVGAAGDCYDRYMCRLREMGESVRIIRQCLEKMPPGPVLADDRKRVLPPKEEVLTRMEPLIEQFILISEGIPNPEDEMVYDATEAPKGELGFFLHCTGGRGPNRMHIRSPSFLNLQAMPEMLRGCLISDVVAVLGSVDFVMGECDR